MKNILLLILLFGSIDIKAWQCQQDNRSLTEILYNGAQGTIFTCKIISIIPVETENTVNKNNVINIGGGRGEFNSNQYNAQIIKVYFGQVDTEIVKIQSMYTFKTNTTYLVYTSGKGKTFYAGGPCDKRTNEITNDKATINEIEIIDKFSDIVRNKRTEKINVKNEIGVIISEGKFKKGKPVGTWKHYYNNGIIKLENDMKKNITVNYFSNGFIMYKRFYKKDTLVHMQYLNNSTNQLEVIEYDIPNSPKSTIYRFETYKNGKLEKIQSQCGMGFYGNYFEFFESGKIKVLGQYKEGNKAGKWITYKENGEIEKEETF
jgi:antitoxin component YwqK of YwqJK toxin-antitoxin module